MVESRSGDAPGGAGKGRGIWPKLVGALAVVLLAALGIWAGLSLEVGGPLAEAERAYAQGSWQDAARAARGILKAEPENKEALRLLARAEARLGNAQSARNIYRQFDPAALQAEDFLLVGRGLIAEGQLEQGRVGLDRALSVDPGHAESLLERARFGLKTDALAQAGDDAEALATRPGWEARGLALLGLARFRQGDPASAVDGFLGALERDPALAGVEEGSPADVRKWLARSLLRTGRPAEARTQLDAIIAGQPGDAEAHRLLSRAALQARDLPAAKAALLAAGDQGADHPEAFEDAPYVGPSSCQQCHPKIFKAQRSGRHAQTFHPRGDLQDLPIPDRPKPDPADPKTLHSLAREGREITFKTESPAGEMRAIVEYVMGSGDRAMTLVGRDKDRKWHELRLSYYKSIADWDRTPGQRPRPTSHAEFLGLAQSDDAVRRCLGCHTTSPHFVEGKVEVPSERGFSCERCHGPAGNHLDAVALGFPDPAIARPRLATAAALNNLCGQCHGALGRGLAPTDPDLARFQASALPLSRCAKPGPAEPLSCLTCHDPHRDAETSPAYYESKCLQCHTPKPGPEPAPAASLPIQPERNLACPVNPTQGCLSCHMPQVQTSIPHTTFTDHFIRVHPEAKKK